MKCYYCNEVLKPDLGVVDCKCGTEYRWRTNGVLYSYSFYAWYSDNWWWGVYFVNADKLSNSFHVKDGGYQTVTQFDFDPKITPTNFVKKLPTLLTFS